MSSPCSFYLRRVPSTMIAGGALGPRIFTSLYSTSQSIQMIRSSTRSSKDCGSRIKLLFQCRHPLSCVRSDTISFGQNKSLATPSNILAGLYSDKKLYHTGPKATEAHMLNRWNTWSFYRNVRRKQINQYFDLWYIFDIIDALLFQERLRNRVMLMWKAPTGKLDWPSRIPLILVTKKEPRVFIEIKKPLTDGPWTLAIIQECLEALLNEMAKLYFFMIRLSNSPFRLSIDRAENRRQSECNSSFKVF